MVELIMELTIELFIESIIELIMDLTISPDKKDRFVPCNIVETIEFITELIPDLIKELPIS